MTLANPACVVVPAPPEPLRIRMPGGLTIKGVPTMSGGIITPLASVQALLAGLSPAMAGLQPAFLIIDAIAKLIAVFKAVPGLIVGNAVDFLDALNEAVQAGAALAQLQPALSLPLMLADMLAVMTAALQALRDSVTELQALSAKGDAIIAAAQAAGDAAQEAVGNCIKAQATAYQAHTIAALGPMGQLMDMAGQLAGMMPSPPALPSIGDASGLDLDGLADFLDNLVSVFEAIHIPGA